jgi:hypothetical protein
MRFISAILLSLAAVAAVPANLKAARNAKLDGEEHQMAARQKVLVRDPIIFGLDMLGWGVDLRASLPVEGSIKVPMYSWEFDEGAQYIYPLEPQTKFQVPNEVFVRTVAEMVGTNRIYQKSEDYVNDLHLSIGLSIKASAKNQASSAADSGGSGGGVAPGSSNVDDVNLGAFSGDVGVIYNKRKIKENSQVLVQNGLESALWQLVVGPAIEPRKPIQDKIDEIAALTSQADKMDALIEFIDRHGTHFIDSVVVGGNLVLESLTTTASGSSLEELAIMANFGFKNMFGLDEGNLGLNITFIDSFHEFEQDATNNINVQGGDPELANFFRGDVKPEETFVNWAKTLIRNPAVIRTRVREISWLFSPAPLREIASAAVKEYMSGNAVL